MDIYEESEALCEALYEIIDEPLLDPDNIRYRLSDISCSLALEHWAAIRTLIREGLLPAAFALHRVQFETLVRSMWLAHVAPVDMIEGLSKTLSLESAKATKDLPMVNQMLKALEPLIHINAFTPLKRFLDNNWTHLNSFVHAGMHPLHRHALGYPLTLLESGLKNSNGLGVITCMHAVILAGRQDLQKIILDTANKHVRVMPE